MGLRCGGYSVVREVVTRETEVESRSTAIRGPAAPVRKLMGAPFDLTGVHTATRRPDVSRYVRFGTGV